MAPCVLAAPFLVDLFPRGFGARCAGGAGTRLDASGSCRRSSERSLHPVLLRVLQSFGRSQAGAAVPQGWEHRSRRAGRSGLACGGLLGQGKKQRS